MAHDRKTLLVVNCGSSTLKFTLFGFLSGTSPSLCPAPLVSGLVDQIGSRSGNITLETEGQRSNEPLVVPDHAEASKVMFRKLVGTGLVGGEGPNAVGHRVIHGGRKFSGPVIIDDGVISDIEALVELAPLHNAPALQAIRAVREATGKKTPAVAVFDTAFHSTIPEVAWRYAIDKDLADRLAIRRYGFHGLAHRFMLERFAALSGKAPRDVRVITLQLGNGCSAAAIARGVSVDTSMGFTPLEGLVMGTRAGDIDPSIVSFVAEKESVPANTVESWLNNRSGLLGISGISRDMRELLRAAGKGDARAQLAIDIFCYRAKKYVGGYMAALGGAEGIVFGGGIGENAPEIRERICAGMDWCGIRLDRDRNRATVGMESEISATDSAIRVYVTPVDEASVIAREVMACLFSGSTEAGK